jgi:hypothetical protein
MSQAAVLQNLANDVRNKTIHLLETTSDDLLLWAPPGTSNHILWHAGHAIWLADALCLEPILGRSMLPAAWPASFGANCRPVKQTPTWPAKAQVLSSLRAQLRAVIAELGKQSDEDLDRVVSKAGNTRLGARIIHAFHDEANHQGEMYLIQKMWRTSKDLWS